MSYPAPFHRLVLMGNLYSDTFNTTLSIVRVSGSGTLDLPLPSEVLDGVKSAIEDYWSIATGAGGPGIHANALLTGFKLNQIGTDGKYTRPETTEYTWGAPRPGGGTGNYPAQLATVATIRTAIERGLASKGRMFLPVCNGFGTVATDGRATDAAATQVATATAGLFKKINDVYAAAKSGDEYLGKVGVASDKGAGAFQVATRVTVGKVTDTVRSRRNKQVEAPMEVTVPA
jgi:hypothetical protein